MEDVMEEFRQLEWRDHNECPLCDEILAVALRRASFNIRGAADQLWNAKYPDPIKMAIPWTPEQQEIVDTYMRDEEGRDGGWDGYTDPAVIPLQSGVQVEALRALELPGFRGVHLSDSYLVIVLVLVLRSCLYDVHQAANGLLTTSGIDADGPCTPLTGRPAEIAKLRGEFHRLSWSTVREAYDEANGDRAKARAALYVIDSEHRV
jgi:hypothetical protein